MVRQMRGATIFRREVRMAISSYLRFFGFLMLLGMVAILLGHG